MAEFEEELIDAEEIFDKIKGRIYNFDEIIVNIESKLDFLNFQEFALRICLCPDF